MRRRRVSATWSRRQSGRGFNLAMAAPLRYLQNDRHHCQVHYHHGHHGKEVVPRPLAPNPAAKSRLVHCVVACLVRGGKVITPGLATCSEGSPRLRPHLARMLNGRQPKSMTQHAEIAALNRLPKSTTLRQLRQMTLVVIRPKYNQELKRSRMLCAQPCLECAQIIAALGIKSVVYSVEDMLCSCTPLELLNISSPSSGTEWIMREEAASE